MNEGGAVGGEVDGGAEGEPSEESHLHRHDVEDAAGAAGEPQLLQLVLHVC